MNQEKNYSRYTRFILFLFSLWSLIGVSYAQKSTLTFAETLDYINKKVNDCKALDDVGTYRWDVTDKGELIISKYLYGELSYTQKAQLKGLDRTKVQVNQFNTQTDYFYTIDILCKDQNSCVTRTSTRTSYSSNVYIRLISDDKMVNQLKNALEHLIFLAEKNPSYDNFVPKKVITE